MKDLLYGAFIALAFILKGIGRTVHILFSSIYQSAATVNDQLQRELREIRDRRDHEHQ